VSNSFKLCPTDFSTGDEKIFRGGLAPLRLQGYGPDRQ